MTAAAKPKIESHWRLLHPSRYLCAADLRGKDARVTIESVSADELPVEGTSDKERAVLISFVGKSKKWVVNKTNLRIIARLHGAYTSDWVGKEIVLFPTDREAKPAKGGQPEKEGEGRPIRNPGEGGSQCMAIRVRNKVPSGGSK